MARLHRLEDIVEPILRSNPSTRDSDRELTLQVWIRCGKTPYAPMIDVFRDGSLPTPETIGRVRRKLQEKDESLRGTKRREKERLEAQLDFIEYATESDNQDIITTII